MQRTQYLRHLPWVGGGIALALVALWVTSSSSRATSSVSTRRRELPGSRAASTPAPARPILASPQHSVFSLHSNRPLAHMIEDGGLLIAAGQPGVAKYVNFMRPWMTWKINVKEEGRRVALATRNVAWLRAPLTEEQSKATTLTLSLKSAKPQGLTVKLNNTKAKPVKLASGWQRVSVLVPEKALWSGENQLELTFGANGRLGGEKAYAAVEWLHLGKQAPREPSLAPAQGARLMLPAGGGLAYYVHPYSGAMLKLRAASPSGGRCELKVRTILPGAKPQEISRPEGEVTAPLAAGRVSRLELVAQGAQCKGMALTDASIVMPGPELKLKRDKTPKHVLFWMIDNARADRYTLYNPSTRVKTPVITALGKAGAVFARAYIQGTESRVSHASIWTGLFPRQHKFVAPKAKLSLEWVTLPEAIKKSGWQTAAVIANGFVSKFWGFGEGWTVFRNTLHQGGGLTAQALADWAIDYIKKQSKPFYLYVGTIDPHVSWRGRQPWLKEYHPEAYTGPYTKDVLGKDVEKMAGGARPTTAADRKRILAIYDSTVSYNDHQLGRVIEALKEKKLYDDTMIVITADHGEELWDYGKVGHGCSLKQELIAVPLIIHYPPLFGRGVRVMQGTNVLSVMPTILDAIGATIPEAVQGESLLPLAQGIGTGYPRPALSTQYELAHAIRLERWKMWVGGKGEPMLFDLESKRGEHNEIAVNHPVETRWLTDALSTFLVYQDRWRSLRWGVPSNLSPTFADDLEAGTGPGPIRPGKGS
jgi:arylsulfatase A-like enzyme